MLLNLRFLSTTRLFPGLSRTLATEQKNVPKKYDIYEQDANKEYKSVVEKQLDIKEGWNSPEEQEEKIEAAKPLTPRQQKIEEDKQRLNWVKPLFDDKKEYRSKFAAFGSDKADSSYLQFVAKPWDLWPSTIKRVFNNWVLRREQYLQSYIPERMEMLGPDLSTAHFIIYRLGKVRFKGQTEWTTTAMLKDIPNKFDPEYIIEEIIHDNTPFYYEGVENIRDLAYCTNISLKNSPFFDDWCLDRLSGNNLPQLETLDLRGCTKLTHKSMGCIYRLTGLKKLLLTTSDTIEWKLSIAMVEEMNPNLTVISEIKTDLAEPKNDKEK